MSHDCFDSCDRSSLRVLSILFITRLRCMHCLPFSLSPTEQCRSSHSGLLLRHQCDSESIKLLILFTQLKQITQFKQNIQSKQITQLRFITQLRLITQIKQISQLSNSRNSCNSRISCNSRNSCNSRISWNSRNSCNSRNSRKSRKPMQLAQHRMHFTLLKKPIFHNTMHFKVTLSKSATSCTCWKVPASLDVLVLLLLPSAMLNKEKDCGKRKGYLHQTLISRCPCFEV